MFACVFACTLMKQIALFMLSYIVENYYGYQCNPNIHCKKCGVMFDTAEC